MAYCHDRQRDRGSDRRRDRDRDREPRYWQTTQTGRTSGLHPNRANTPKVQQRQQRRPSRPKPPSGPATFEPKVPAGGKQYRRMLKAACLRLSRLIKIPSADVLRCEDPIQLTEECLGKQAVRKSGQTWPRGPALILARKIVRMRQWRASRDEANQSG